MSTLMCTGSCVSFPRQLIHVQETWTLKWRWLLQSNWLRGTYLPQLSPAEYLSVSLMYVCAPSLAILAAPAWNTVSWFIRLVLYKATKSTVILRILLACTFHNIQSKLWVLGDATGIPKGTLVPRLLIERITSQVWLQVKLGAILQTFI